MWWLCGGRCLRRGWPVGGSASASGARRPDSYRASVLPEPGEIGGGGKAGGAASRGAAGRRTLGGARRGHSSGEYRNLFQGFRGPTFRRGGQDQGGPGAPQPAPPAAPPAEAPVAPPAGAARARVYRFQRRGITYNSEITRRANGLTTIDHYVTEKWTTDPGWHFGDLGRWTPYQCV